MDSITYVGLDVAQGDGLSRACRERPRRRGPPSRVFENRPEIVLKLVAR